MQPHPQRVLGGHESGYDTCVFGLNAGPISGGPDVSEVAVHATMLAGRLVFDGGEVLECVARRRRTPLTLGSSCMN